ncbi:LacI family DNA-binding transcriptional regulator [Clostridium grantii]|uniref:Transcriptional regulator, LacI family n=1 Tax=Clostridium grantii DSM 8605 TaxID=1121316 RepID=A0A1M5UBX2_9CLOT|nr:LacI family DNA-binding transcriptional regulator [Clostridium grantii]SHH60193.1 transcriptional regulator, LacI family [Clostridium grantii DSM 8605]
MKSNVKMKDLAEKLGVSNVTISKALNDKEGVSDELKYKIKKLADDMGYRVNTLAKSMKEGISYNIGVIIAERFTGGFESFYLQFHKNISTLLETHNYYGILQVLSEDDEENLVIPKVYYENKVDGFIVLGQVSKDYIESLQNIEVPVVFLDFYDEHENIDTIITDSFYSAYELTNYLISNGHKNIAYVGNIYATSSIQDRFLGYYKSLLEHRIKINYDYVISDRNQKGKFIDFELPDVLPTAFVCNCDQVAYNLIRKIQSLGFKVPEECSIVGFDNDIYATISEPKITTVQVDIIGMAETAVNAILEKVKDQDKKYGRILVKARIIYRDSVKNISAE